MLGQKTKWKNPKKKNQMCSTTMRNPKSVDRRLAGSTNFQLAFWLAVNN